MIRGKNEVNPVPNDSCESSIKSKKNHVDDNNVKMWASSNGFYYPCDKSVEKLPPDQYTVVDLDTGVGFSKRLVTLDDLYILPDCESTNIISAVETFWGKKDKFKEYGLLWKRGILLYGPPGSGKTSIVQMVANDIVNRGGLAIYCDYPGLVARGLQRLRKMEPDTPIVVIIEDIDAIAHHSESQLLSLLDGEMQINNILFIATTNYPELLDKRLVNRPSRFDIVKNIGMPSAASRREYLKIKNPKLSSEELDKWVKSTDNYSMAHLKEMIVSIECLGNSFDDTVKRINSMITSNPNSSEYKNEHNSFGFVPIQNY